MSLSTINAMTDAQVVQNILNVYHQADDAVKSNAAAWYVDANAVARKLADKHNVSLAKAAGVLAALSPRNKWERNQKDADAVLTAVASGLGFESVKVCTFNPNKTKAFAIAASSHTDAIDVAAILVGQKIQNFFLNIYNPMGHGVTVDGHAYSIAIGTRVVLDKVPAMTAKVYDRLVSLYTLAAEVVGVSPCQMQAITWTQHRINNGIGTNDNSK